VVPKNFFFRIYKFQNISTAKNPKFLQRKELRASRVLGKRQRRKWGETVPQMGYMWD
jgi:hypothetical protein